MTFRFIIAGLIGALALCLPVFARAFDMPWPWVYGFFFTMLGNGLECFITFFHEMGHSVTGWFYGAPTIPMFDFVHGGGWAYMPVGRLVPLLMLVWGLMGYGIYLSYREYRWICSALFLGLLFNIATAFTPWHDNVFDFMGPGAEPVIGAFLLIRALYDLAPRGGAERFMNAMLGFAMPLHSLIMGWALMHSAIVRQQYWTQKDAQGSGDFDKIADRILVGDFNAVVMVWVGLSFACIALPFVLFAWSAPKKSAH